MMRTLGILVLSTTLFSISAAETCEGDWSEGRFFLTCRTETSVASASLAEIAPDRYRLDLGISNLGESPIEFVPAEAVRYLARSPTAGRPCTVYDASPRIVAATGREGAAAATVDALTLDRDGYAAVPIRFALEDPTCVLRYIRVDVGGDSYYFDPKILTGATIERTDGPD